MARFRALRRPAIILGVILVVATALPSTAHAQNPNPWAYYSYDSASTDTSWPPTAPYAAYPPTAVVVEGIYASTSTGCTGVGNRYTPDNIEARTVYWLNQGYDVITEISPYNTTSLDCGNLTHYENVISIITSYVETHAASTYPSHWAGFMLDEETSFWKPLNWTYSTQLQTFESLSSYTASVMDGTSGMSWYFDENQPNEFYTADTYALYTSGAQAWLAPQVYEQTFLDAVNQLCAAHSNECTNMVTVNSTKAGDWGNYAWVVAQVSGAPWSNYYWASGGAFWNEWRPE